MNKWIRKAVLTAAVVLSLASLAACGKKTDTITMDPANKASLEESAKSYAQSLYSLSDEDLTAAIASALKEKNSIVYNGLTNYQGDQDRLGAFQSVDNASASQDKDGYKVVIESSFEKRPVLLTLGLSDDMSAITELSFEPEYSMAEKMEDAAGNFVVGMMVVFGVLIFISFIIYMFKYVNKFALSLEKKQREAAAAPKKAAASAPAKSTPAPAAAPANTAGLSGAELQAVIAAAIAAYESDNGTTFKQGSTLGNGLVVRSIKRHY